MKQVIKKIYTIIVLIKNVLFRKNKYILEFQKNTITKKWYYNFKHWGFAHDNLEMVAGADDLCEHYANGKQQLIVKIICSNKPKSHPTSLYDEFIGEPLPQEWTSWQDKLLFGRYYSHVDPNDEDKITRMWICPVTLFVLGRYPKYIYVNKTIN